MSKIPHTPTKHSRELVQLHSAVGTTQELIADILEIDSKTLRKYYRKELDHACAEANAKIGGVLFNKAIKGDVTAAIFWMKVRAGWKTVEGRELSGPDGKPIEHEVINVDGEEAKRRLLARLTIGSGGGMGQQPDA